MPSLTQLEEQARRRLERLIVKHERAIQIALRDALNAMRRDMQKLYKRYAVNGILSNAEMTRANRLASMEKQMIGHLNPAMRASLTAIDRLRPEQYQAAFFNYAWTIDSAAGVALDWGVLNKRAIVESLNNRFYYKSLRAFGPAGRATLREQITTGLTRGKSFDQMSASLTEAVDITRARALRIARTEGGYAQSAGQSGAYDQAKAEGVEGKREWLSTLDGRTRGDHAAMDGVPRRDDGLYHLPDGSTGRFPKDQSLSAGERINCRCDETFVIEGFEPQLRRTRDEGLVPNQTYADWILDRRTF